MVGRVEVVGRLGDHDVVPPEIFLRLAHEGRVAEVAVRLAIDAAPESAAKRNACARSSERSSASSPARIGITIQSGTRRACRRR